MNLRAACGALTAILLLTAGTATAQNYPTGPVRFVVPFPAGGGIDTMGRLLALRLAESLGKPVITDNRPGANGMIGSRFVARAPKDGYTLLVNGVNFVTTPSMFKNAEYDPVKDFDPISLLALAPNILVVHPSLPVTSVKELIALARAKPGELNYGAGAIGASTHLSSELFNLMAGVKITHVPYKSSGLAVNALLGNQIQVMFGSSSGVTPHIKAGRLRALAVSTAVPSPVLPGLPTVAAAGGLPGYESASTAAMFAPAKTSRAIIDQVNREVLRALARPEVKERFSNLGVEVVGSSPQETAAFVKADMATTARIIKEADIRGER
jgi:tripartite-type tricarboxylate transporter receptor subunit TctC